MSKTTETTTKKKSIRITIETTRDEKDPASAEARAAQVTAEGAARRRRSIAR